MLPFGFPHEALMLLERIARLSQQLVERHIGLRLAMLVDNLKSLRVSLAGLDQALSQELTSCYDSMFAYSIDAHSLDALLVFDKSVSITDMQKEF